MARPLVAEVAAAGEDHREVVAVGDLDRHLVANRAARLDDRTDPGARREGDPIGEREVRVAGHHRHPGPIAGPAQGYLDRYLAARLGGPDAHRRTVAGQDDRVRTDVADRPPGEEQVGQLLEPL